MLTECSGFDSTRVKVVLTWARFDLDGNLTLDPNWKIWNLLRIVIESFEIVTVRTRLFICWQFRPRHSLRKVDNNCSALSYRIAPLWTVFPRPWWILNSLSQSSPNGKWLCVFTESLVRAVLTGSTWGSNVLILGAFLLRWGDPCCLSFGLNQGGRFRSVVITWTDVLFLGVLISHRCRFGEDCDLGFGFTRAFIDIVVARSKPIFVAIIHPIVCARLESFSKPRNWTFLIKRVLFKIRLANVFIPRGLGLGLFIIWFQNRLNFFDLVWLSFLHHKDLFLDEFLLVCCFFVGR